MANEWADKAYNGGVAATTLNGAINSIVTSITCTTGSNLVMDGSTGPFVITVDRTTLPSDEEKMLVTARAGNVLTVQRGYDGTNQSPHNNLASVEHVLDAYSIEQANAFAAAAAANGSMAYRSAALAYSQLPIGANGLPIVSNGSIPQYAALGLSGLAAAVLALLVPAGSVLSSIAASAPSGWLMLDGTTTAAGADVLYPSLWAVIPASWKSGTALVLPDARGRSIIGAGTGAGLTARTLSSLLGAEGVTLSAAESGTAVHGHGVTDPGHSHPPLVGSWVASASSVLNVLGGGTGGHVESAPVNGSNVSVNNAVGAAAASAHTNMQPSIALNHMVKAH